MRVLSKKLDLTATASLNYFNFRLNFYEPFIETFNLNTSYKSDEESKSISLDIEEVYPLNINLSTALFENIVIGLNYYNETMDKNGYAPSKLQNSQMRNIVSTLETTQNTYDYRYSLENHTGEEILVNTKETGDYVTVYANQVMVLDFGAKQDDLLNRANVNLKQKQLTGMF